MVKAANAAGISMMIVPIVRSQISRLVCVSIDYPTPRDMDGSRPTGEKRQYRGAARFPGPAGQHGRVCKNQEFCTKPLTLNSLRLFCAELTCKSGGGNGAFGLRAS